MHTTVPPSYTKRRPKGVPAIEQYTRTDRKRTESVLHSLSSFLDKHCICRHKCHIKLEVICWPCQRDIVASNSDIALWSQWYYIRLPSSRSEYHSAIAEYHCEAIELARGEYNCGTCSTAGATKPSFLCRIPFKSLTKLQILWWCSCLLLEKPLYQLNQFYAPKNSSRRWSAAFLPFSGICFSTA